jgi:hypothetical protein
MVDLDWSLSHLEYIFVVPDFGLEQARCVLKCDLERSGLQGDVTSQGLRNQILAPFYNNRCEGRPSFGASSGRNLAIQTNITGYWTAKVVVCGDSG